MAKMYYDKDANMDLIKTSKIAIIGYGIQGRGQSLCLRDSGLNVLVSELEGTPNYEQAIKDGFSVLSAAWSAVIVQRAARCPPPLAHTNIIFGFSSPGNLAFHFSRILMVSSLSFAEMLQEDHQDREDFLPSCSVSWRASVPAI